MVRPLNVGVEKALQKIKHYCSYQERNHREVKGKLYALGLYPAEIEALLSRLIEENYLNEERYAIAFAGGKFRMNDWGKVKIKYELKRHQISDYCIKKALSSIEEPVYLQKLNKLSAAKISSLKAEKNDLVKKRKVQQYLIQKGYETGLVNEVVSKV